MGVALGKHALITRQLQDHRQIHRPAVPPLRDNALAANPDQLEEIRKIHTICGARPSIRCNPRYPQPQAAASAKHRQAKTGHCLPQAEDIEGVSYSASTPTVATTALYRRCILRLQVHRQLQQPILPAPPPPPLPPAKPP